MFNTCLPCFLFNLVERSLKKLKDLFDVLEKLKKLKIGLFEKLVSYYFVSYR